jgi:hypothetical protein
MKTLRVIIYFMACISFVGCGAFPNRYAVTLIAKETLAAPDKSVVLMSSGAPGNCTGTSSFITVVDPVTLKPVNPLIMQNVDGSAQTSEFASHQGLVSAFLLPPGKYKLLPSIANSFVVSRQTPTFDFEAMPGEITYIGELFMTKSCSLNTSFTINDQLARDSRMALEKNPAFSERKIVKRLMTAGESVGYK